MIPLLIISTMMTLQIVLGQLGGQSGGQLALANNLQQSNNKPLMALSNQNQPGKTFGGQSVGQLGERKDGLALANNLQKSNNQPLMELRKQQLAGSRCPGRATCLRLSQWRNKKCRWSSMNLSRPGKAQQQVVAMINRLRGNINYKCKLGNKPGLCCPGENECYFDRNIPRPLLHNQCKFPNQRCATKGNGGICENNGVCTTSAICHEAAKPICDEERRCASCKQNAECSKKSNDLPFCGAEGKCVACPKGKRMEKGCVFPSYEQVDDTMFLNGCKRPGILNPSYGSLYRTLRQDEDLNIGILARKPQGTLTPVQHVGGAGGTGKDSETQWISFTTDVEKAVVHSTRSLFNEEPLTRNRHGNLIEARRNIQVSRKYLLSIGCTVVDLTRNDVREEYGLLKDNDQANAAAKNSASSCEVLVKCPVAIKIEGIEQKGQFDSHGTQLNPKLRAPFRTNSEEQLEKECEYTFPNTGHHQALDNNSEHCRQKKATKSVASNAPQVSTMLTIAL